MGRFFRNYTPINTVLGNRFDNVLNGTDGRDHIFGLRGDDTIFAGAGNDLVFGGRGDDDIDGGADNDTLYAGKGDDTLRGGEGNDIISGGWGFDTAVYDGAVSDYTFKTWGWKNSFAKVTSTDPGATDPGTDLLFSIEALFFAGSDYTLFLNGQNNAVLAGDDAVSASEDGTTLIAAATLLANDQEFDGDAIEIISVESETDGVSVVVDGSTVIYDPGNTFDDLAEGVQQIDTFTYTVDDGAGGTDSATVLVTITGVNDDPVLTALANVTVDENTTAVPAMITATDVDSTDLTFSLSGVDAALFSIDELTGAISFLASPDFETPLDAGADNVYDITVTVTDDFGGVDSDDIAIAVADVDEISIVISEIMYNPASGEDDWEWVEIVNTGPDAQDLSGWVFDDINSTAQSSANIASGSVAAGGSAILYNADDITAEDFEAAWGVGINLIAVTGWNAAALNNGGDTVSLWSSFAAYSGDNATHANTVVTVAYDDAGDWPADDGNGSIYLTDLSADANNGLNWALSTDGGATPVNDGETSVAAGGNSGEDVGSPGGETPPPQILISEIMYNPASSEDDWEWVEIYNSGTGAIDLSGWVFDDINSTAQSSANIASGSVSAGGSAILYNADDLTAADFEAAWGSGINLIAVTGWSAAALNNGGDTVSLWESFAAYSGDNTSHSNTVVTVAYDDAGDWPSDDGNASIYLTDLSADLNDGTNWALSTDGGATPVNAGQTSSAAGGNSGADVGSPGGATATAPVLISEVLPNPTGTDPSTTTIELSGTAGAAFSGVLIAIESDPGTSNPGDINSFATVSGTFDANGLLTATISDLENPSFTLALLDGFTGDTSTDLDSDNDGVADDLSTLGSVFDAIGVPDTVGDEGLLYGAQLGGEDFAFTGTEPRLIFRDGSIGAWYAVNDPDNAEVIDITGNVFSADDFDSDPTAGIGTFGAINPSLTGGSSGLTAPYAFDFESDILTEGWQIVSVDGDAANTWFADNFGGDNFAAVNAFGDSEAANDWLISPLLDISGLVNPVASFANTKNFDDTGLADPEVSFLVSADYDGSGDPNSATWTPLPFGFSSGGFEEAFSGEIDLSGVAATEVYFAFQYQSSGTGGGTSSLWQIDDFFVGEEATTPADPTLISTIQGAGATSPLNAETVTIEAIVVGDFQDGSAGVDGDFNGFYVQEEDSDADENLLTSEGLFVFDGPNPSVDVASGDLVRVTGTVTEFFGETQLSSVTSVEIISSGNTLPTAATISFPVANVTTNSDGELIADLEAYEGMRVTIPETMTIGDLFTFGRFGDMGLQAGGLLETFTQANAPSVSGFEAYRENAVKNSIILDDGSSFQNPSSIPYEIAGVDGNIAGEFDAADPLSSGDTVEGLTGVIRYSRGSGTSGDEIYRLNPTEEPVFVDANPRDSSAPDVGGSITVASYNLLNFFTTLGDETGGSGPNDLSPRGADNGVEFTRQIDKLITALAEVSADVFGLVEIENEYGDQNGDGEFAIDVLVNALNTATGEAYDFVDPGTAYGGSDAIMVGLIYNTNTVEITSGTTVEILTDADLTGLGLDFGNPVFDGSGTSRAPLAATFTELATDEDFTVAVNHFKSKGSVSPFGDNAGIGDGSGNNDEARTQAAQALDAWLDTNPTGSVDEDILIIGDLNAYAMETPIQFLKGEGYTDLVDDFLPADEFPFSFGFPVDLTNSPSVQNFGALDYALANSSLAGQITGAAEWQINSVEASILDYNTNFQPQAQIDNLYDTSPFRSSDHDPLIVGLNLGSSPTGAADDFIFV
ncbi:MAG: ExeM/NucH family extracellular endonuclease [Pseudomonadota bacterium]